MKNTDKPGYYVFVEYCDVIYFGGPTKPEAIESCAGNYGMTGLSIHFCMGTDEALQVGKKMGMRSN